LKNFLDDIFVKKLSLTLQDTVIFLSILTRRAKLPRINRNLGDDAADEQGMSESTLFIKAEFYL